MVLKTCSVCNNKVDIKNFNTRKFVDVNGNVTLKPRADCKECRKKRNKKYYKDTKKSLQRYYDNKKLKETFTIDLMT